eukprot:TRINITY_DN124363_c0_g1_i1.p1 TRINITY_DN124363_c0_g1~~TRINITY_DN124363_c0_g1_i1.p1  ORF type:complete len:216 (+),score=39.41 TRINITY_DN124363_c0_g1_i1:94-741(+)
MSNRRRQTRQSSRLAKKQVSMVPEPVPPPIETKKRKSIPSAKTNQALKSKDSKAVEMAKSPPPKKPRKARGKTLTKDHRIHFFTFLKEIAKKDRECLGRGILCKYVDQWLNQFSGGEEDDLRKELDRSTESILDSINRYVGDYKDKDPSEVPKSNVEGCLILDVVKICKAGMLEVSSERNASQVIAQTQPVSKPLELRTSSSSGEKMGRSGEKKY